MQISYEGTEQDFIDAQKTHAWRRYTPASARIIKILTIGLGLGSISIGVVAICANQSLGFAVFEILCGLYLVLARPVLAPLFYKRAYRRYRTEDPQEVVYTITEDSIAYVCPGKSCSVLEWKTIRGLIESRTTILLYVSAAYFLIIPKRALSDGQPAELKTLLQQKDIRYGCPKPVRT
jgi:hypothetical protein